MRFKQITTDILYNKIQLNFFKFHQDKIVLTSDHYFIDAIKNVNIKISSVTAQGLNTKNPHQTYVIELSNHESWFGIQLNTGIKVKPIQVCLYKDQDEAQACRHIIQFDLFNNFIEFAYYTQVLNWYEGKGSEKNVNHFKSSSHGN